MSRADAGAGPFPASTRMPQAATVVGVRPPTVEAPPIPHAAPPPAATGRPAGGRALGLIVGLVAALALAGCGGRFDAGRAPTVATPRPTPVVTAAAPTATPCVSPASQATVHLPGARTLADGLQILDRTRGTGPVATDGSSLSVLYTGTLANGTVFDASSRHGNKPFTFTLGKGQVIAGWDQGLVGARAGGTRELVIPASLGYRCTSPGAGIPANSTLVFTVHLVSVR